MSVLLAVLAVSLSSAKGTKTLYIADHTVACAGDYECIQIREKTNAAWRNYPDTIEGFNYEEGYEYKLSVQQLQTKNTLAGVFDEKYKLVKVVSKKKTNYNPSQKLADKKWIMRSMDDTHRTISIADTTGILLVFDIKNGQASGKGVCNTFHTAVSVQGSKITFTDFGATKMLCKASSIEGVIFSFIKKTTTYTLKGNVLTLIQPDGSDIIWDGK